MTGKNYVLRSSGVAAAVPGDFCETVDDAKGEMYVPDDVLEVVRGIACTTEPTTLHFLSIAECFPTAVAVTLGWNATDAVTAAEKLRQTMETHGLDAPVPQKVVRAYGAFPPSLYGNPKP